LGINSNAIQKQTIIIIDHRTKINVESIKITLIRRKPKKGFTFLLCIADR